MTTTEPELYYDPYDFETPFYHSSEIFEYAMKSLSKKLAAMGLDPATLDPSSRLAMLAFRGVTSIDARQRLMLVSSVPGGPPDWADRALLPPVCDAAAMVALTRRLRGEGWLRPDVAGRLVFGLPADPAQQVDAIRQSQRQGATAFALCPTPPVLPPSAALAAAFSAATYPYRP